MSQTEEFEITVTEEVAGLRLDQALARLLPQFSRSRLKEWVLNGHVTVDGVTRKPRDRVLGGEMLRVRAETPPVETVEPEPISLQVLYEDESIIVIDKPPGLVVHPGAGNPRGTLQNALLHHRPGLAEVPRAGIVHRLDKDTSGVMVVAAGVTDHTNLVRQLERRSVQREYRAVCDGVLTAGGTVDAPIARHQGDRLRMAVRQGGRPAVTHYRVVERFRAHTDVRATLETGRTHQIRVHLAHLGYPLVGDRTYGGRLRIPRGASEELRQCLRGFRRQALHAVRLKLIHPRSGEEVEFISPLRADHESLLAILRLDAQAKRGG
jgi:23S rRNA pseudouridine1911/1915/1917 synthase